MHTFFFFFAFVFPPIFFFFLRLISFYPLFLWTKLALRARLVKSFLLLMSIYRLARAASNLFLLITHNFQVVWPTQRLAPHGVCSEGCCDCLLFIYPTPPLPTFTSPPIQFSMNNQTAPEKPDLVVCSVFMQIPTQRTKHTQTECNVALVHLQTHTQSPPAFTECKHATTTHTNNSVLHHKAQIHTCLHS